MEWGVKKIKCMMINVYSKCDLAAKKRLWDRLVVARKNLGIGAWCVLGDFNAVAEMDERRGVNDDANGSFRMESTLFKAFRREMELEDQRVLGRNFTWFHPNGIAMSRIDRVLISNEWNQCWGDTALWVLPRDVSDHCPLVLKVGGWDWGPKPFRCNNFWLENRKLRSIVEEEWRNGSLSGWMGYILKEKLKKLKLRLKEWNTEEYGGMEDRITKLVEEIAEVDARSEMGVLGDADVQIRKAKFEDLWRLLRAKDSLMVQRSRSKWLKEGDANTKYFHNCVKGRASRNHVKALFVEGDWVQSPSEIRRVVVEYFSNHVASDRWDRPKLDGVNFDRVSDVENGSLIAPFTGEEVDTVVKESDGNKSPGPDGLILPLLRNFGI
jgi:hypothetical protein